MNGGLIKGDTYQFTAEEIAAVAVFRLQRRVYSGLWCPICGFGFVLTPNDGMSPKAIDAWITIAHLTNRLYRGEPIDGVTA